MPVTRRYCRAADPGANRQFVDTQEERPDIALRWRIRVVDRRL